MGFHWDLWIFTDKNRYWWIFNDINVYIPYIHKSHLLAQSTLMRTHVNCLDPSLSSMAPRSSDALRRDAWRYDAFAILCASEHCCTWQRHSQHVQQSRTFLGCTLVLDVCCHDPEETCPSILSHALSWVLIVVRCTSFDESLRWNSFGCRFGGGDRKALPWLSIHLWN